MDTPVAVGVRFEARAASKEKTAMLTLGPACNHAETLLVVLPGSVSVPPAASWTELSTVLIVFSEVAGASAEGEAAGLNLPAEESLF